MKNKENNNDEWMRVLRNKVDAAQTPSQHDADNFEALMAHMAASTSSHTASAKRPGLSPRRVAALVAAAVLAGAVLLVFRPAESEDASHDTLADNATVTGTPGTPHVTPSTHEDDMALFVDVPLLDDEPLLVGEPQPAANRLLAQATSPHKAQTAVHQTEGESSPSAAQPATPASQPEAATTQPGDVPASATQEESTPSSNPSEFAAQEVLPFGFLSPDDGGTEGGTKTIEDLGWASPEGFHVSLYASGGAGGSATARPTFAYALADADASGPLAAPRHRLSDYPGMASSLTHYDYDACTFVHHTPLRVKALAQCDFWTPLDGLTVSAGGGLMYTELTSTVYTFFTGTTYTQCLRMVGIPIEADVSWMLGRRWNVFAGIGLTGEYCYHARLDTQDQPERPFHFGAYGQLGIGMRVTDDLQLGMAAEYAYAFTHTVLNTLRSNPAGALGLGISFSYIIP